MIGYSVKKFIIFADISADQFRIDTLLYIIYTEYLYGKF